MNKPTIIYFGTPDFSVIVLDSLLQNNFPIKGVVTAPNRPRGRNHILTPTPVKAYAQKHDLQVFTPTNLKDNDLHLQLEALKPDLFVVFSYGKIIPGAILPIPTYGALNVHPSLLPKYRGPSPVQSQILAGETKTGVTIIKMNKNVDAGPIVAQETMDMPADATFESLIEVLSNLGAKLLNNCILDYTNGKINLVNQDENAMSFTKIIKKDDGYLSQDQLSSIDPLQFNRMVRAYHPWPGVWTKWQNKTLKLLPNQMVQIEGKPAISVKEFLNGYPQATTWVNHAYGL